jgi:hypothetical protein
MISLISLVQAGQMNELIRVEGIADLAIVQAGQLHCKLRSKSLKILYARCAQSHDLLVQYFG